MKKNGKSKHRSPPSTPRPSVRPSRFAELALHARIKIPLAVFFFTGYGYVRLAGLKFRACETRRNRGNRYHVLAVRTHPRPAPTYGRARDVILFPRRRVPVLSNAVCRPPIGTETRLMWPSFGGTRPSAPDYAADAVPPVIEWVAPAGLHARVYVHFNDVTRLVTRTACLPGTVRAVTRLRCPLSINSPGWGARTSKTVVLRRRRRCFPVIITPFTEAFSLVNRVGII